MAAILTTLMVLVTLVYGASAVGFFSLNPSGCTFWQSFYENSTSTPAGGGVYWQSSLTGPVYPSASPCSRQAVLRVTPPYGSRRINIKIALFKPSLYSFNVGDSISNNGWGGDSSSNNFEAEIHNYRNNLYVYGNAVDKTVPPVPSLVIPSYFESCPNVFDISILKTSLGGSRPTNLRMNMSPVVAGKGVTMNAHDLFHYSTLYIGVNRVVGTSGRRGYGACEVCVKFT